MTSLLHCQVAEEAVAMSLEQLVAHGVLEPAGAVQAVELLDDIARLQHAPQAQRGPGSDPG